MQKENKVIVLFFDTYEIIQSREYGIRPWLENELFPILNGNTRIFVVGRHPLAPDLSKKSLKSMELDRFDLSETSEFLEVNLEGHELAQLVGGATELEILHELVGGRPILIALLIDWYRYHGQFSFKELLNTIGIKTKKEITPSKKDEFEGVLVYYISNMKDPEDWIVANMAIAFRRMTPAILSHIWEVLPNEKKSIEECHDLLKRLKDLSFIKYKKIFDEETVLLHDEMRLLILKHCWKEGSPYSEYKPAILGKLVEYYKIQLERTNILKDVRSIFSAERLYYELLNDAKSALENYFFPLFDTEIAKYNLNICELLLNEVTPFAEEQDLWMQLAIDSRRLRFEIEANRFKEAREIIETIAGHKEKSELLNKRMDELSEKEIRLVADFKHERGRAYGWLNEFEKSETDFLDVERFYRILANRHKSAGEKELYAEVQQLLAWALNMLGYFPGFRAGNFEYAEKCFLDSIDEFLKLPQMTSKVVNKMMQVYNNLNAVCLPTGRFDEAINYGIIAESFAREFKNSRMLIRCLNMLGLTYKLDRKYLEAVNAYSEAENLLTETPDNLLRARVLTGKALTSYKHFSNIQTLEYYRRGEERAKRFAKYAGGSSDALNSLCDGMKILVEILPTRELADAYFDMGEHNIIDEKWSEAVAYFKKCVETAKQVKNEYRETDALVMMLMAFYHAGHDAFEKKGMEPFRNEIEDCRKRIEEIRKSGRQYNNLYGKLNIVLGDFEFEKYRKFGNPEDIRKMTSHYITACDHMFEFNASRFHSAVRLLYDRLNRLFRENRLAQNNLEIVRNIWYYDEKNRDVCRHYRSVFDEIADHFFNLEFYSRLEKKEYEEILIEKVRENLRKGKSGLRFAPLYGKMLLGFQHHFNSDDNAAIAEAHRTLGQAYFINREIIEAEQNYEYAKQYAEITNDDLLKIRILAEYGRVLFRKGQYARPIEYFLPEEIERYKYHYIREYEKELDETERYFSEAEKMGKNAPEKLRNMLQSNLQCQWAQFLMVTKGGNYPRIEKRLAEAIQLADFADDVALAIDARESLITFFNLNNEGKKDFMQLISEIDALNRKKYSPELMGLLEVTQGNFHYAKALRIAKEDSGPSEKLKSEIEKAFHHFVMSTRYQSDYSESNMHETINNILKRIARLDGKSIEILRREVFPELRLKVPNDPAVNRAFEKIEQFIHIRSEIS